MSKNTASHTAENYLKAIFHIMDSDRTFTIKDLSQLLEIKMPTVNSMMKKFAAKNWVTYESYKPVIITETGVLEAAKVVRKHRLTEMYLVEKMNFGWEHVHEIAEQLEHIHSEEFFDKMDELLNFPKTDPHGEPIPDKNGQFAPRTYKKLSERAAGETVILKSLTQSDSAFLKFLDDRGLKLGTKLTVLKTESFDGSMLVNYHKKEEVLSKMVCERLLTEKINI